MMRIRTAVQCFSSFSRLGVLAAVLIPLGLSVGCQSRNGARAPSPNFPFSLPEKASQPGGMSAGASALERPVQVQAVSKVAKVRAEDRFLVFESIWPHEAGQPLFVWRDGALVARLKVTDPVRRRDPNYWVANIVSGTPESGDLVYDELNLPKATPRPETKPVETGLEPEAEVDSKQDPETFFENAG